MTENILAKMNGQNPAPFRWENGSDYSLLPRGGIRISAPAKCDYFIDPAGDAPASHHMDSAPFLYLDTAGDFVMQALVSHKFQTTWDAAALMARSDARHWAKLCFEASDFGTQAVVSVVTNHVSDDANGVNYHWPVVWLQIVRKGNIFGMHYGPDGIHWNMVRYFCIEAAQALQVGMVAQCPAGAGAEIDFHHFSLELNTVKDIRAGV
jgi:regulation of enolase protein 1 (concanavalin A-like superfamily)